MTEGSRLIEFGRLRILLACGEHGCAISCLLENEKGGGVAGHASGISFEGSILSAVRECFRAAHLALRFELFNEVSALHAKRRSATISPGAHSLAYAYGESLPNLDIETADQKLIDSLWSEHGQKLKRLVENANVTAFDAGHRAVVYAECPSIVPMRWGIPDSNLKPHFVG